MNQATGKNRDPQFTVSSSRIRSMSLFPHFVLSWLCYVFVAWCARSLHESGTGDHTLLGLLAVFGIAFGLHLPALRRAIGLPDAVRLLTMVWLGAVAFRATLLLSDPIEEIDLYRYVWDGAVSTSGVSPFRYSRQQVLASSAEDDLPPDLARLVALRDRSPELDYVLRRIHFGELPTIYPPVSQAVFAVISWLTPKGSSVATRLIVMKTGFVVFDLLTLGLVIRLLRQAGRHRGWSLAYGWCPLVVKEIANSGHLDSLATCLMTLAVSLVVSAIVTGPKNAYRRWGLAMNAATVLALGVGAKLFPVVLAPLLLWVLTKHVGWSAGGVAALAFSTISLSLLWPMRPSGRVVSTTIDEAEVAIIADDQPPIPPAEVSTDPRDPSESLRAFLGRGEMNDFLFLIVIENLRPSAGLPREEVAWFTVTPESWREKLAAQVAEATNWSSQQVPFALTRLLFSGVFLVVSCILAAWAVAEPLQCDSDATSLAVRRFLPATFLTLVWFWLLLPTQNPWYLTWSLPFLPFARSRAWLFLSGLAFVYYLRFWMAAQFSSPLLGTPYPGPQFFDYVVTWLEFAPWLVWLLFTRLGSKELPRGRHVPRGVVHANTN
jgi:hypothetical protein